MSFICFLRCFCCSKGVVDSEVSRRGCDSKWWNVVAKCSVISANVQNLMVTEVAVGLWERKVPERLSFGTSRREWISPPQEGLWGVFLKGHQYRHGWIVRHSFLSFLLKVLSFPKLGIRIGEVRLKEASRSDLHVLLNHVDKLHSYGTSGAQLPIASAALR